MDNFNVPMGAYDSAQVADLREIHILDTLSRIVDFEQIWFYWDDRIMFIPDTNEPKASKIQKKFLFRAFELLALRIEITSNI